jgi:hypothetical protein
LHRIVFLRVVIFFRARLSLLREARVFLSAGCSPLASAQRSKNTLFGDSRGVLKLGGLPVAGVATLLDALNFFYQ